MNGYEDQPNADEFAPDAKLQRSLHGLTPFVTSELQEAAVSGCGADGLGVSAGRPVLTHSGYFAKLGPPWERAAYKQTADVVNGLRGQYLRSLRTILARSEENRSPVSGSSHGAGSWGSPVSCRTGRGRVGGCPSRAGHRSGLVAGSW